MNKMSPIIKKLRELTRRSKLATVAWDSVKYGTYIKKVHGKLK